jgi:hypothetical protein
MGLVERFKVLPARLTVFQVESNSRATPASAWKIERSGNFGGFEVTGWRYSNLAIWHVKVWSINDGKPGQSYVVAAGEIYPESLTPSERFATLRLIAFWETVGFK